MYRDHSNTIKLSLMTCLKIQSFPHCHMATSNIQLPWWKEWTDDIAFKKSSENGRIYQMAESVGSNLRH